MKDSLENELSQYDLPSASAELKERVLGELCGEDGQLVLHESEVSGFFPLLKLAASIAIGISLILGANHIERGAASKRGVRAGMTVRQTDITADGSIPVRAFPLIVKYSYKGQGVAQFHKHRSRIEAALNSSSTDIPSINRG